METRFFQPGDEPEYTTKAWYMTLDRAPHLEQEAHGPRIRFVADWVRDAVDEYAAVTLSDLGSGDGGLLSLVGEFIKCWGYDILPANVEAAQRERGVNVVYRDFLVEDIYYGDISVCTEVLEHLIDPHGFVQQIQSRILIASVPDGETLANHYPHHAWGWDREGFAALLEQGGYWIVRHEGCPGAQVIMGVRS